MKKRIIESRIFWRKMIFLLVTRQDNDLEVEIKERRRKKENGGGLLPVAASNRAPRNEKRERNPAVHLERPRGRETSCLCRLISLPYLGLPLLRIIWRASAIFQRSSRFLAAVFRRGRGGGGRSKDDDDVSRSPANAGETVPDSCLCKTPLLSELMEYRAVSWNLLRWTY